MIFFTVGIDARDKYEQKSAETLAATFGVVKKEIKDFNQDRCLTRAKSKDFTQIVCLAHSNDREFGGLNAKQFVDALNNHIGNNLDYKAALADIYLIGCEVGLIRSDGSSLAQDMANRLFAAGYRNVRIHAVTARSATSMTVEVSSLSPKPSYGGDKRPSVTLKGTTSTGQVCFKKATMAPPRGENAIQQGLDTDEHTFWPQQVNHIVDARKTYALEVIARQIHHLNNKIAHYQRKMLRGAVIKDSEDKVRILSTLCTDIKSSVLTWEGAAERINRAADNLKFHGGIKESTTRKILLALAIENHAEIDKIFGKQDKKDPYALLIDEIEQDDSESPGSDMVESSSRSRTPSPVRQRNLNNNNAFFNSEVREPLLSQTRDNAAEIRYQINEYIKTLRAEKQSKRNNPFVGWICRYKLSVFENLQQRMQSLDTLDEIRAAVIHTYLANRKRIGSGLHNPSRAVSLISNILIGEPRHGTHSHHLVLDDDALRAELEGLTAPRI